MWTSWKLIHASYQNFVSLPKLTKELKIPFRSAAIYLVRDSEETITVVKLNFSWTYLIGTLKWILQTYISNQCYSATYTISRTTVPIWPHAWGVQANRNWTENRMRTVIISWTGTEPIFFPPSWSWTHAGTFCRSRSELVWPQVPLKLSFACWLFYSWNSVRADDALRHLATPCVSPHTIALEKDLWLATVISLSQSTVYVRIVSALSSSSSRQPTAPPIISHLRQRVASVSSSLRIFILLRAPARLGTITQWLRCPLCLWVCAVCTASTGLLFTIASSARLSFRINSLRQTQRASAKEK